VIAKPVDSLSDAAVDRLRDAIERPALPDRYELIEVIGRGGMGVVWRARDTLLEREVAVKVVASHYTDASHSARLRREAKILAQLEHPGIVSVHDLGVLDDGRAWYAMRLVRGTSLDVAARTIAERRDLLRIVERLCDTIAYAHAHHVVHRDLKPGNVMLGPFGEVLVLDWGVAGGAAPASGTVVGTPGYMSPEQEAGRVADERSDVYGLGAIVRDLCAAHAERVPRALQAIIERATAREPADRYASPIELRDDIRRLLEGARVRAHRETAWEAAQRIGAANRTLIVLVASYVVLRLAILWWRRV
jgi:serine/threonine protein kinase